MIKLLIVILLLSHGSSDSRLEDAYHSTSGSLNFLTFPYLDSENDFVIIEYMEGKQKWFIGRDPGAPDNVIPIRVSRDDLYNEHPYMCLISGRTCTLIRTADQDRYIGTVEWHYPSAEPSLTFAHDLHCVVYQEPFPCNPKIGLWGMRDERHTVPDLHLQCIPHGADPLMQHNFSIRRLGAVPYAWVAQFAEDVDIQHHPLGYTIVNNIRSWTMQDICTKTEWCEDFETHKRYRCTEDGTILGPY